MLRITQREKVYFDYFVETCELACAAAKMLDSLVNDYTDVENKVKAVKEIEHNCDISVHNIIRHLNRSFITPIDREDIHQIAKELDNITDHIETTAQDFIMYNVESMRDEAIKLSSLVVTCTQELKCVMDELRNMKSSKLLSEKIIEVNRIENEGDELYRAAITKLFRSGADAIEIVKWSAILDSFENTLDACEDVANIIEGVAMKNA